ncbi:MAG: hypothetical protein HGB12_04040 [Bacteroidetes bacterium]|nr:hypothetical protein [Bacteroidota bacterium]
MNTFIVIILSILLIFAGWNFFSTNRLIKNIKSNIKEENNDSRYFELKYRIEFIVAIFSVIIVVIGFLGYNTFENAKKEIHKSIIDKNDSLFKILSKNEIKLGKFDSGIVKLEGKNAKIDSGLLKYDSKAKSLNNSMLNLKNLIEVINSKNILKQNYYIVNSLSINLYNNIKKIYFNDLITDMGDKLPIFTSPPIILPIPEINWQVQVNSIKKDYFEVLPGYEIGDYEPKDSIVKFSVLIIQKKEY